MSKIEERRALGPPGIGRQMGGVRRSERPAPARTSDNPLQVELVRENERLRARVAELEAEIAKRDAAVTGVTLPVTHAERQRRYRERRKAKP